MIRKVHFLIALGVIALLLAAATLSVAEINGVGSAYAQTTIIITDDATGGDCTSAGKWKQRGFGNRNGKEIEYLDTIERGSRLCYKLKLLRSGRLRSFIIQNQLKDIAKIRSVTREINLNADRKRFWLGRIESIDAKICNDSMPLSFNNLRKEDIQQ